MHRLAPAGDAPALLSPRAAFFEVAELPEVVDFVEGADLDEPCYWECQFPELIIALFVLVYEPPTPSMTSLRAARPFCQCVSHSRRLPGCSVYDRSSKTPPS